MGMVKQKWLLLPKINMKNDMHQGSDSIVIIPTYNECENIEKIIRAVFAL